MSIPVSTAWKQAIQAQFRYPGYLKMQLSLAPPDIVDHTTVQATDTGAATRPADVLDARKTPYEPAASLEHNRWSLGGNQTLVGESDARLGWWSSKAVSATQPVSFLFNFSQTYDLIGLYIRWDTQTDSWATDFTFEGLDSDGQVVATKTVHSDTRPDEYYELAMGGVRTIKLTFTGWSKPDWRARIEYVVFGKLVQFENSRILNASYTASLHPLNNQLPSTELEFEIANYERDFDPKLQEGVSAYLTRRQLIQVQWGFESSSDVIEWIPSWPLWLSSWSIPADSQSFKLTSTSRLAFLTSKYSYGTFNGALVTYKQLATTLLSSLNITLQSADEIPWQLDPVLDKLKTRAPLPVAASNTLLQLIASATGCILCTDVQTDKILITAADTLADYDITGAQQLGDPAFKITNRLHSISINLYTYKLGNELSDLCTFEGTLSGHVTLQVSYELATDVAVSSISGATLKKATYYARVAVLELEAPDLDTDVSITISGKSVEESKTLVQTYIDEDVIDGLDVTIDNALITETSTLQYVAEAAKNYYLRRTTTTIPYLGYPELQPRDVIAVHSTYGNFTGCITQAKLDFNGGFEGSLTVQNRGVIDD